SKWQGRCPACQEWSALVEEAEIVAAPRASALAIGDGAAPVAIALVPDEADGGRLGTGLGEGDRRPGGGLVAGSLVLLGGEPGVGKSTLLVQALAGIARAVAPRIVLYATGEESVAQTAMRARRLGATPPGLVIVAETDVDRVIAHAR